MCTLSTSVTAVRVFFNDKMESRYCLISVWFGLLMSSRRDLTYLRALYVRGANLRCGVGVSPLVSGTVCSIHASKRAKHSPNTSHRLRWATTRREPAIAAQGRWMETAAITQGTTLIAQGKEVSSTTRPPPVLLSRQDSLLTTSRLVGLEVDSVVHRLC